jgi:hypothetical protein
LGIRARLVGAKDELRPRAQPGREAPSDLDPLPEQYESLTSIGASDQTT